MRAFVAFLKKEVTEAQRNGKLLICTIIFVIFGIMNPAIAKLTPYLMELFAEEMGDSGIIITEVAVDALTSWVQFFKNMPMALIAFVLLFGGTFSSEFESGSFILIFTKGLARCKVLLAKTAVLLSFWTIGYWTSFAITYAYNAYYWDNSIVLRLAPAVLGLWLFGIFALSVAVMFSILLTTYSGTLIGTFMAVLVSYVLSFIPKVKNYVPTALLNSADLMAGTADTKAYLIAAIITALLSTAAIFISIPLFNKKEL